MPTNKKKKSKKKSSNTASSSLSPYAIVNGCDGCGAYVVLGVVPSERGDFTIYNFVARVLEGVRDGFIHARVDNDYYQNLARDGNRAVKMSLQEALVLFVNPVVERTEKMPRDAIPVIRWWQKQRRPGPSRYEELVQPLLNETQLSAIAEYTPMKSLERVMAHGQDEYEDHRNRFEQYFYSMQTLCRNWYLNEADIQEMNVTSRSPGFVNPLQLVDKWVQCPRLMQRHVLMAAHMRSLYTVDGDEELKALWSKEMEIEVQRCRFTDSGQARVVRQTTTSVFARCVSMSDVDYHRWFFETPDNEKQGRLALQAIGSWYIINGASTDTTDSGVVFNDFLIETTLLLQRGVYNIFHNLQQRVPGVGSAYEYTETLQDSIASCLLNHFTCWQIEFVFGYAGPLVDASRTGPPAEFVLAVDEVVQSEPRCAKTGNGEEITKAISAGFWDVACMAVHPEHFDFTRHDMGGRGARRTATVASHPPTLPTFESSVVSLVNGFCGFSGFLDRFSDAKPSTLKRHLSVTIYPSESMTVNRMLCPRYFVIDENCLVPSDELILRANGGDDAYMKVLLKLMAANTPHTTLSVLHGVARLRESAVRKNQKYLRSLEEHRSTSTTRKGKRYCAACGARETESEDSVQLQTCSRCRMVRYCHGKECQRKHWGVHKKVCSKVKTLPMNFC